MSQEDPAPPSAASVMATSSGEAKGKRPATPLPLATVPPVKKPKTGGSEGAHSALALKLHSPFTLARAEKQSGLHPQILKLFTPLT